MIQFMDLLKLFYIIMRVYLCCGQAAVAQQVFYGLYVSSIIQQVCCKGVAQYMRAFLLSGWLPDPGMCFTVRGTRSPHIVFRQPGSI